MKHIAMMLRVKQPCKTGANISKMEELPTEDDERPGRHSISRSEPLIAPVKNTMGDRLQSCRRGWKIHRFMPHNFNERFRKSSDFSKFFCAKTLD
jgi:hypothetical protein